MNTVQWTISHEELGLFLSIYGKVLFTGGDQSLFTGGDQSLFTGATIVSLPGATKLCISDEFVSEVDKQPISLYRNIQRRMARSAID